MTGHRRMYAMAILLIGWLVVSAECRLVAGRRSYLVGGDNNTSHKNATQENSISSLDDGKINFQFCGIDNCSYGTCNCCAKPSQCYPTFRECQSRCPSCYPKCPPELKIELNA
ncbi:hypothetical protein ACQJBY_051014 [Aegilops geniculata]